MALGSSSLPVGHRQSRSQWIIAKESSGRGKNTTAQTALSSSHGTRQAGCTTDTVPHAAGAGPAPRHSGVRWVQVGVLKGVTKAESVVWRVGLTIKGEHWVCSAGFKERQIEVSCNESSTKMPSF